MLFLNLGTRCAWVVNATPEPLYHIERDFGTQCKAGWVGPGPVWMGAENLASTAVQSVVSRYTSYSVLEHCNDKIDTLHSDDSVKAVGCRVINSSEYLSK